MSFNKDQWHFIWDRTHSCAGKSQHQQCIQLKREPPTTGTGNSIKGFMQRFTGFFCVAVSVYVMSFSYQESICNLEWGHGESGRLLSHMHFGYNSRAGISTELLAGFLTSLLHPLGMNRSLIISRMYLNMHVCTKMYASKLFLLSWYSIRIYIYIYICVYFSRGRQCASALQK